MYSSIALALSAAKTNPATLGLIAAEYDIYLTQLLTLSAGTLPTGVLEYRPFYAAAKLLEQLRSQQTVKSADGAEFTGLAKPIESLLSMQAAIDSSLGTTVPQGFEAIALKPKTESVRRTRSFGSQFRP